MVQIIIIIIYNDNNNNTRIYSLSKLCFLLFSVMLSVLITLLVN